MLEKRRSKQLHKGIYTTEVCRGNIGLTDHGNPFLRARGEKGRGAGSVDVRRKSRILGGLPRDRKLKPEG